MRNKRACANDEARPVTDQDNRAVKGNALLHKTVYQDRLAQTAELRARQEEYERSLPKDPVEALREIYRFFDDWSDFDGPQSAVKSSLLIVNELASADPMHVNEDIKQAVDWLSWQGIDGLKEIEAQQQRVSEIARQFSDTYQPFEA